MSFNYSALSTTLDDAMRRFGISSRQLGEKLKLSPATFTRLRQGQTISLTAVMRVCEWLDLPVSEFDDNKPEVDTLECVRDTLHKDSQLTRDEVSAIFAIAEAAYRLVVPKVEK